MSNTMNLNFTFLDWAAVAGAGLTLVAGGFLGRAALRARAKGLKCNHGKHCVREKRRDESGANWNTETTHVTKVPKGRDGGKV